MNPVFFLSRLGVYLSIFRACASQFFQREYIGNKKGMGGGFFFHFFFIALGGYPACIYFVWISFVIVRHVRIEFFSRLCALEL